MRSNHSSVVDHDPTWIPLVLDQPLQIVLGDHPFLPAVLKQGSRNATFTSRYWSH